MMVDAPPRQEREAVFLLDGGDSPNQKHRVPAGVNSNRWIVDGGEKTAANTSEEWIHGSALVLRDAHAPQAS